MNFNVFATSIKSNALKAAELCLLPPIADPILLNCSVIIYTYAKILVEV